MFKEQKLFFIFLAAHAQFWYYTFEAQPFAVTHEGRTLLSTPRVSPPPYSSQTETVTKSKTQTLK